MKLFAAFSYLDLMRYFLWLLSLFFSTGAFGQLGNKVLIIDTLISSSGKFAVYVGNPVDSTLLKNVEFIDTITDHHYFYDGQIIKTFSTEVRPDNIPNIILPISSDTSSAIIKLPLDDSGGKLILKGVFLLSADTIRISRHEVFHNCIPDTFKMGVFWYRDYNADTSKRLKLLKSKHYPDKGLLKECNIAYPKRLSFLVNQKKYTVSLQTMRYSGEPAWFCKGHKKMNKWRERLYEKRIEEGKPYKYFSEYTSTNKYGLSASLDFHVLPDSLQAKSTQVKTLELSLFRNKQVWPDTIISICILYKNDSISTERVSRNKFEYSSLELLKYRDSTSTLIIETDKAIYNLSVFNYCYDYISWSLYFPGKIRNRKKHYAYTNNYNGGYNYQAPIKYVGRRNGKRIFIQE